MGMRAKLQKFFGGSAVARRWIVGVIGRAGAARIVALCLLQSLMALNAVGFALAMQRAIDAAVAGSADGFWLWCGIFAGILLVQVACIAINRALLERTRTAFENQLRDGAFADVLDQSYEQVERTHSGELMTRMTSDVAVVAEGASMLVPTGVSMTVRLIGVLVTLFKLVPRLTLIFLAGGCAAAVASVAVRPLLKSLHARMQEAEGGMRSYLQECLDSLLVVHAFGCEGKVRRLARDATGGYRCTRLRKADASNACSTLLILGVQVAYVLGFAWCGFGILTGTCSYGTLMAVVQLTGQLQSPFSTLGGSFSKYSSMLASADRLMALRSEGAAADREMAGGFDVSAFDRLRLSGVTFSYVDCEEVLRGFDFSLRAGEFVGIAGPSGAGKSTFMKVLLGAYAPKCGEAWACDAAGTCVSLSETRGLFAYVPQGNRLMAGTIRDVVAFVDAGEPDEQQVIEACKAACAWDFVSELPDGLGTVLGQRGSGLSEGQMQRLAVARAVYSDAPVLLLDEATSALDAATEGRMLENLRALPGRSAVLVTHREATLAACDRVVEVREGGCG